MVDLEGQLSSPAKPFRSLSAQGQTAISSTSSGRRTEPKQAPEGAGSDPQNDVGHYSNPGESSGGEDRPGHLSATPPPAEPRQAQRRLRHGQIDDLVDAYLSGDTVNDLAQHFGINRTTVMAHLERRRVGRRTPHKLTDQMVTDAAQRYTGGETLAEIAERLGVAPSTLTRELQLAGITIRRRGRPASD